MKKETAESNILARKMGIITAVTVTIFGLICTLAWVFGMNTLVQFPTYGFILSYSEVLVIFLSGLCFINLIFAKQFIVYKILSLPLFLFAGCKVLEIAFHTDIGITNILDKTLIFHTEDIPGMLIGGAINTLLLAIIFLLWPVKKRTSVKSIFTIICLFSMILIAVAGCAVYLLPIDPRDFALSLPIHPVFALSQIILATGLIAWNIYLDSLFKIKVMKWFALLFASGVILFHFFLITTLLHQQRLSLKEALQAKSQLIKLSIHDKLTLFGTSLATFSIRVSTEKSFELKFLEVDANYFLRNDNSLKRVGWFDANLSILQALPSDGQKEIRETIDRFSATLKSTTSIPTIISYFNPDSKKLWLLNSISWDKTFQGGAFFEIDLTHLMKNAISQENLERLNYNISCNYAPILYTSPMESTSLIGESYTDSFSIYDLQFDISLKATSNLIINKIFRSLVFYITIGGIIGGLLTGLIIYLIQVLKEKIFYAETIDKELSMSNEIMKVMNEAETVPDACHKILSILNQYYDWSLFQFWQWNPKWKKLELVHVITHPGGKYTLFEKHLKELRSHEGTIFQQAFTTRMPIYCQDYTQSNYVLREQAVHEGLKGVFVVPVYHHRELGGVIELFSENEFIIDPKTNLIDLMKTIGNEFSYFIERRESNLLDKELTSLVRNSKDAIYKATLDLKIASWNLGAEMIYGWKEEEIIGQGIEVLYPENRIHEMQNIQSQLINLQNVEHFKTERRKKDGTIFWVENSYSPIIGENGKLAAFSVICRDISKEKSMLDTLVANEEKFRLFVDATKSWIWEMDPEGSFTFSNAASTRLLGFDPQEILGRCWLSLSQDRQKLEKEWETCQKNKVGWKQKIWQAKAKNGTILWLESTADPIFDKDKRWIGFRGVDRDVTEEMKISTAKNEFISMISHELRTPLTSILGSIKLMSALPSLPAECNELITLADRNAERLLKLINDILDVERISLGKLELKMKPCNLQEIVQEAIRISHPLAIENQIELIEDHLIDNTFVEADYDRLLQVILNLISNSIKFSSANASVILNMELQDKYVRLLVRDSGQGIPYEIQGKIFEKFVQADTGDTKTKGTGLGLNISKNFIEQMGGKIGFVSEPGKGALFFIDLPLMKKKD